MALVSGYASDEWSDGGRTLTLRRRDAHAWVEVWDPQAGWYAVDPTPATARASRHDQSVWAAMGSWFGRLWERVVRFDDDAHSSRPTSLPSLKMKEWIMRSRPDAARGHSCGKPGVVGGRRFPPRRQSSMRRSTTTAYFAGPSTLSSSSFTVAMNASGVAAANRASRCGASLIRRQSEPTSIR